MLNRMKKSALAQDAAYRGAKRAAGFTPGWRASGWLAFAAVCAVLLLWSIFLR